MLKTLLIAVASLVTALTLAAAATLLYLRSALPQIEGEVRLAGIHAPVEVWRDSLGVPHIWAVTPEDLLFAQGYVHAQDRLWQMELLRRAAEGRLSQIFGERFLPTDRYLRTLGLWRAAGVAERELTPEIRRWLDAYSAGANAWIRSPDGALPPELLLLRTRPEPWSARHVLAVEKMMAMDLSLYGTSRSASRASRRLGEGALEILLPGYPTWGGTIVGGPTPPEIPPDARALLELGSLAHASNSWVIGGEHTRSGKPILANDMHLALRAPSLWYLAALHADRGLGGEQEGLHAAGMTLPGAPFVIAGHSRAVAWGYTNAMVDDIELFVERVDPTDPGRYLVPGGTETFRVEVDTIPVKGRAEAVVHRVRYTRHGPVISDLDDATGGELLSLRWAAHDPAGTFLAIPAMNAARTADELVAAVEHFDNPHQNVVYADTAGAYGYIMGGRVPIRANGAPPPLHQVPGWTGEWDWTGELPFSEHPRTRSPGRGYVVTANNRQAAGAAADRVTRYWAQPFRAMRITELVEEAIAREEPLDARAVHRMQLDVTDARALRYRTRAAAAAERAGLGREAEALLEWDGRAHEGSAEATLFYAWWEEVRSRSAARLYGEGGGWFPSAAVDELLEQRSLPWAADGRGAFDTLAASAMHEAALRVGGTPLGEVHRVRAEHALGGVPLLDRLLGLTVGGVPHGGTPATINVAQWGSGAFPKTTAYGPSQRHVVDMGDVDGDGGFILPTGQSGIPFSRHYRDQFPAWKAGGVWLLPLAREKAEARAVHRLRLVPLQETAQ